MAKVVSPFNGYVCVPYLHSHDSIELKDKWVSSRNIDSMFFVTATFSEDSKPYFSTPINHYILAKCKNTEKTKKEIKSLIMIILTSCLTPKTLSLKEIVSAKLILFQSII